MAGKIDHLDLLRIGNGCIVGEGIMLSDERQIDQLAAGRIPHLPAHHPTLTRRDQMTWNPESTTESGCNHRDWIGSQDITDEW